MTVQPDLRVVDEATETAPAREPQVFVRSIVTPPGAPWEQRRAAGLEARHGSPIPLVGVAFQLRRLEMWSPGGRRYAAFYVRSNEVQDRFVAELDVEGRRLEIEFASSAAVRRQARTRATLFGAAAACGCVLAFSIVLALKARIEASARLDQLEQQAATRLHETRRLGADKAQALMLDRAHGRGRELRSVLNDLALLSAAKTPGAHIQAFHWDRGYMAVEVRGEAQPFGQLDREIRRADRPSRPGVWLWAIGPRRDLSVTAAGEGGAR